MKIPVFIFILLLTHTLMAQNFCTVTGHRVTLSNGVVTREITAGPDSLYSALLEVKGSGENFIRKSLEFSFLVNDIPFSGFRSWKVLSVKKISDENSGHGVGILMESRPDGLPVRVELNYLLYPDLPVIRKWIVFTNTTAGDIKLEGLNIEDLQTHLSSVTSVVHHNYGRMKQIGTFVGTWDDPVVVIHDITSRRGIAVGNETPSVLKRTAYHTTSNNIEAGLTLPGQDYPFRKWLKPGESWESPKVFIAPYINRDNGYDIIENEINRFVVNYMKPRIYQLPDKPTFVYNTWNPFRTFINDSLIREVAKAASDCGIQEFIIDDGWQINREGATSRLGWGNNYGDWKVDETKFPGGLKPPFDYIKSLGMKPGVWISVGSATKDSRVFREHPEWFVKNKNNLPGDLHIGTDQADFYTSCFGTHWPDYIRDVILGMVKDYGLAYAKLDFAVATSAYVTDPSISGCYANDHPFHRDQEESFMAIFERVLGLFDELHQGAPGLFIDCTFETAGKLQLMDYAIARYAEGNWLSNFEEPSPLGPLRIRQMAWWRAPAVPASSLVIGNMAMDDPDFEFGLKSLIGTLPIVLGDPRQLTPDKRASIKQWSAWMQEMQEKYDYMTYRKDLPGFGEPKEGAWDGWMRINFNTHAGGIFGVFRQGALEDSRKVFLKDLDPGKRYIVREAPEGKEITRATGKELMERGIPISITNKHDGKIYEVELIR